MVGQGIMVSCPTCIGEAELAAVSGWSYTGVGPSPISGAYAARDARIVHVNYIDAMIRETIERSGLIGKKAYSGDHDD